MHSEKQPETHDPKVFSVAFTMFRGVIERRVLVQTHTYAFMGMYFVKEICFNLALLLCPI